MADIEKVPDNIHSEETLDQFSLDEPWKPVDYLDEENGNVTRSHDAEGASETTNYSNLFQINMSSIQSDIQKIRSASVDYENDNNTVNSIYNPSGVDEDNLQKYIHEDTDEHLKYLDSTTTINNKSIDGDIEKLRRFQMSSFDEADEVGQPYIDGNSDCYAGQSIEPILKDVAGVEKNDNKADKGEGETKGMPEDGGVDEILGLLPDLDTVLHDQDPVKTYSNADNQDASAENTNIEELDVLETLELPDVPDEQPHSIESNVRDESLDTDLYGLDNLPLLPTSENSMPVDASVLSSGLQANLMSSTDSSTIDPQRESSDRTKESAIDTCHGDNTQEDKEQAAVTMKEDQIPQDATKPKDSSKPSENPEDIRSEIPSEVPSMEEVQNDLGAKLDTPSLDTHQAPDNKAGEQEITSALIADLLLAEEECNMVSERDSTNVNINSEARVSNSLEIHNEVVPSTSNGSGSEGPDADSPTMSDGRQAMGNDLGALEVSEELSNCQSAGGESRRATTMTSSGSEDLEEFVQDQYSNTGSMADSPDANARVTGEASEPQDTNVGDRQLGFVPPKWVPDKDAKCCMLCETKFTVVKRRHHCRACGKVLCAGCCNMKFNLPYMSFKPARVCQLCCDKMIRVQNALPLPAEHSMPSRVQTVPVIPEQYDSEENSSPAHLQGSLLPQSAESPPSYQQSTTYQGPLVSGTGTRSSTGPASQNFYPVNRNSSRLRTESEVSAVIMFNSTQTNLPPVIRENNGAVKIVNSPDLGGLFSHMHDKEKPPVVFLVNKNLIVRVKIVHLDCCIGKVCWCFCTDGMGASNQEEIVLVNEYYGDDVSAIKCVLQQLNAIFEKAKQGNSVGDLGCTTFNDQMLLNPNLTSMLFFKATLQCTQNLIKPSSPYLFGQYLHANEVPWGKVFPMRVFLRLGLEYKNYPCPIYNDLNREVLYSSGGRTIVNLLADLRNFQYSIQKITGVSVMLKNKDTVLKLPQNRYDEVIKLVNTAEDHVLCFGGNFSTKADSYLVAVENDGGFTTQTIHVSKKSRRVTLASFIVFSASLKPSQPDVVAKTSIVEDGIMVQVTGDFMKVVRCAIKDMKDHSVPCGMPDSNEGKLIIEWTTGEPSERSRHKSPIDGMSLDNLTNMKIRHSYDYASSTNPCKIHWMEVYFLPNDGNTVDRLSARELGQMTSSVAKACMEALRPHLATLCELKMSWIGLRIGLDTDSVEYKIGSNLQKLPDELTADLDDKLIPAIHGVMSNLPQGKIQVELIFQVVRVV